MAVSNFNYPWQRYLRTIANGVAPSGTLEITENGEYDVSMYAAVDVQVEGGGSTDFTVAHVEMTSNSVNQFIFSVPNIFEDEMLSIVDSEDMDGSTFDIVLYKGSATMMISELVTPPEATVTGDIEVNRPGVYTINGDGTITLDDAGE